MNLGLAPGLNGGNIIGCNDGVIGGQKGMPRLAPTYLRTGECLIWDGTNDYVRRVQGSSIFSSRAQICVGLWHNTWGGFPGGAPWCILAATTSYLNGFVVEATNSARIDWYVSAGVATKISSPNIFKTDKRWHFIVCTWRWDGIGNNNMKIYYDGRLVAVGNNTLTAIPNQTNDLYFGYITVSTRLQYFWSNFAISYSKFWEQADVDALYNGGLGGSYVGRADHYWPMNEKNPDLTMKDNFGALNMTLNNFNFDSYTSGWRRLF